MGLWRGDSFWLCLTTASTQCLHLSERFFHSVVIFDQRTNTTAADATYIGLQVSSASSVSSALVILYKTSCRWVATVVCHHPSPPPWVPKRLAPPSRRQRFPRPTCCHVHRCSRLTRQHGGEESGLVTLTFDLFTLKVMYESRVTWATSEPILVFLDLSVLDLGPMYTTDVRQKHRLMPPPIRGGGIIIRSYTALPQQIHNMHNKSTTNPQHP